MVTFTREEGSLLTSASLIPFEPNAFSQHSKKKLVVTLQQDELATVQEWESKIDADRLCSCITRHGLRVRFDPQKTRAWKGKKVVPMPPLRNAVANVRISLTGTWSTEDKSGICCHATDIYLDPEEDPNALLHGTEKNGYLTQTQQSEQQQN